MVAKSNRLALLKCRFLLPGIYLLLMLLFVAFFILGAGGHGWNPFGFAYYLVYPIAFLFDLVPKSSGPENIWLLSLRFFIAGLIQWALIGYLIDKLIAGRQIWR